MGRWVSWSLGHTHSILFLWSHRIGWRPKHLKTWLWNSLPRTLKWGEVWAKSLPWCWRLLVAAVNPPKAKLSQMTFLIWFVAEPQLLLAALPDGRAVFDIHADWSLVTKGGFMPRQHCVQLNFLLVFCGAFCCGDCSSAGSQLWRNVPARTCGG